MHIIKELQQAPSFNSIPVGTLNNIEEGVFDTSLWKGQANIQLIEEKAAIAQEIILRGSLKAIPCAHPSPLVTLIIEGEFFRSSSLYATETTLEGPYWPDDCRHSAVHIYYSGYGYVIAEGEKIPFDGTHMPKGKLCLTADALLYTHQFSTLQDNLEERITTFASSRRLITPPGIVDFKVLRPYGGYFKPGISLEKIRQVYFTLAATQGETKICLEDGRGGLQDDANTRLIYPTPQPHQVQSLGHLLREGQIKLKIESDLGIQIFQSFSYHESHDLSAIDITFRPT